MGTKMNVKLPSYPPSHTAKIQTRQCSACGVRTADVRLGGFSAVEKEGAGKVSPLLFFEEELNSLLIFCVTVVII